VRFIGEPATRIAEDYLRILRFFRFHAWYGQGHPDATGLHACILARVGLETLSRERLRMELLKLLLAPHATPTLAVMAETGILGAVLGGVPLLASFENVAKAEATMGFSADAVRRLGALAVTVKEDGERLGQRLRLSNAEAERLVAEYRAKQQEGAADAEAIVAHATAEAERIAAQSARDLEQALERRQRLAEERIAQAEAKALDEVRAAAIDVAIAAARDVIAAQINEQRGAALLDAAIVALPERLR